MTIRFECEECGEPLQADVSLRGETEACPNCGNTIRVPADAESAPAFDWSNGMPKV